MKCLPMYLPPPNIYFTFLKRMDFIFELYSKNQLDTDEYLQIGSKFLVINEALALALGAIFVVIY